MSEHRILHGIPDCETVRVTVSSLELRRNYEAKRILVQQAFATADVE